VRRQLPRSSPCPLIDRGRVISMLASSGSISLAFGLGDILPFLESGIPLPFGSRWDAIPPRLQRRRRCSDVAAAATPTIRLAC